MKWYDAGDAWKRPQTFNFVIGGRGIGKTYSALKYVYLEKLRFIYLRNTQRQIDLSITEYSNPYKQLNIDNGSDVHFKSNKEGISTIEENGELYGYALALSTFGNLRGVSFPDVTHILYEEFNTIDRHRRYTNQYDDFCNMYETVNRNRELMGKPPVKVLFLSNSTLLDSDLLIQMGIVKVIEDMIMTGESIIEKDDLYSVELVGDNDVSREKEKTAIYRMTEGSNFASQALYNQFSDDNFFGVKRQNINEYIPLCAIDDLYIYRHKNNSRYYISPRKASVPVYNSSYQKGLFMRNCGIKLLELYMKGKVFFSDYTTKLKLIHVIK